MSGEFGEPESGMLTFMKAEIKDTTEEMFREAKRKRQELQQSSTTSSSTMSTPSDTIHGFKDSV